MLGQLGGRLVPDVVDAQGKDQPVQIVLLRAGYGLQKIVGLFLLELFQGEQLFPGQGVDIRRGVDQPFVHQLGADRHPQAVDIHGVAGGKMDQVPQRLGRAFGVDAAEGYFVVQVDHRRAAGGADMGHPIGLGPLGVADHADHLGDDLPGLAHLDGVADAQAQLLDDLPVVEGGPGNGGARQQDRLKRGGGSQHAGAAHVDLDIQQAGLLDLWRIFEGNGPPGKLGR